MNSKIFKCPKCGTESSLFKTEIFNVGGNEMKGVVCPDCGTLLSFYPNDDWYENGEDAMKNEN